LYPVILELVKVILFLPSITAASLPVAVDIVLVADIAPVE